MSEQLSASMLQQDSESRPYWEGLAQGELRIQRCDACGRAIFYPRAHCPDCFSEQLSWIVATGSGTIYTYTVVHQAYGLFAADTPFIIAIVELEEGARMLTRIIDAARERVAIGAAVRVTFETVGEAFTLPYFRLSQ